MISCVVFDFDGTLVDSNHIKKQTFFDVTRPYDPDGSKTARVLKHHPEKDRYGIFEELVREFRHEGQLQPSSDMKSLSDHMAESYTTRCEQGIATCEEIPGTSVILKWIFSQQIPMAINSRTPTETLKKLFAKRSFARYITEIYGAPASKTQNLQHIQHHFKLQAQEILFIGDSEDDREAALETGCHFVGLVLKEQSRFQQTPATQIIDLFQLQPLLEHHLKNQAKATQ